MKHGILFFLSIFILRVYANNYQEQVIWENKTYKESIKTVLIYKSGQELSFPVINLDKHEKITLMFDEIGTATNDYSWSIIHCNANWTQSDLLPVEYIEGFNEGDIEDYSFSQNTLVNYINYTFEFPNNEAKPMVSGNYIVKIFERGNPEKAILTRRFYVTEQLVEISAHVDLLKIKVKAGLNQRVNIDLNCNSEIENPAANIFLKISKNQTPEKDFSNIQPSYVDGNMLRFQTINKLAFHGGHEFRHFDIKNFRFLSDRLLAVDKKPDIHHVFLREDENRALEEYRYKPDLNGKRSIKLENTQQSNIMADYCKVHFVLNADLPLAGGDYYVYGDLTNWQFTDEAKLKYDFEKQQFFTTLYLKQGYYNYLYLLKNDNKKANFEQNSFEAEGNHAQTENNYYILTYYKDYSKSYERLVGYTVVNSTKSGDY